MGTIQLCTVTERQKRLVQASFEKVRPIAPEAAALFYSRLFELDPSMHKLFNRNMREQGAMFMQMIDLSVKGLDNLDSLLPTLEQLGASHAHYGVKDKQYATVGNALLWTIESALGDGYTPEIRDAWQAAFDLITHAMQTGASQLVAAPTTA